MLKKSLFLVGLVLCLAIPASASSKCCCEYVCADKILYNGKIVTMDEDSRIVDCVAIRDGKFAAVGMMEDLERYRGNSTEMINLYGKTVVPGLIDSHIHVHDMGIMLDRTPLNKVGSISELLSQIKQAANQTPEGEWILASKQWHESQLKEKRMPTCWELDEVAPNHPVFIPRGGHVCVVNSKALEIAGITKETPDPKGGTIVRNDQGEPNGFLLEHARDIVEEHLPKVDYETQLNAIVKANSKLNSMGITGAFEPGLSKTEIRQYMELREKDLLTVRTDMSVGVFMRGMKLCKIADPFYRDFGDDLLKIGAIKFMADGGVEGAYLEEPYEIVPGAQTNPEYRGSWFFKNREQELQDMFMYCAKNKWQMQIHIVGDACHDEVLQVIEQVDRKVDINGLRWAVMHAFLPSSEHMERMKKLGMVVTVQGHPTYLGYNQLKWWGQERAGYAIPIKSLLEHGLTVGGGSDAMVVSYDPFLTMWWMVTRNTVTTDEPLGPEQAISIEDALRLYTIGSAKTMFWEDKIGSIEEGKLADLAVLDRDILTIPSDDIRDVRVIMTMLGGSIVYKK